MKDDSKHWIQAPKWLLLVGNILEGPKDGDCLYCISFTKSCPGINQQTGNTYRQKKRFDKLPCKIPIIQEKKPQQPKSDLEILKKYVQDMSWIMEN